jgi:hypothetical protein
MPRAVKADETLNGRFVTAFRIDMGFKLATALGGVQMLDDCSDAICDFVIVPA